jgi:S1-C subfamily serine protease
LRRPAGDVLTEAMSSPDGTPRRARTSAASVRRAAAAAAVVALVALAALAGCDGGGDERSQSRSVAASGAATGGTASDRAGTAPLRAPDAVVGLQTQFERVVQTVSPAVVQIESGSGLGSGVVWDEKGSIVTNAHVVGDSRSFTVTLGDGKTHDASLVGAFRPGDLAVIRLDAATPRPAAFADSSKVRVGDFALAIGNPLGLRSSVTDGIVSSVGRTVSAGEGVTITSAIQTSAPINPGNSGGALVDINGRVIGIPTLAALDPQLGGAQAPGIGFAIPSNTVRDIAGQLIASGRVTRSGRAFLGVRVSTVTSGGVLVTAVESGGPADKAGIRPGDVIVSVAGQETPSTDALATVLATLEPGRRVPVVVARGGDRRTVTVTLGELPAG